MGQLFIKHSVQNILAKYIYADCSCTRGWTALWKKDQLFHLEKSEPFSSFQVYAQKPYASNGKKSEPFNSLLSLICYMVGFTLTFLYFVSRGFHFHCFIDCKKVCRRVLHFALKRSHGCEHI